MTDFTTSFTNLVNDLLDNPFWLLLIALGLIILAREIRCWYWRINERIELQNQEYEKLKQIVEFQVDQLNLLEKILKALEKQPEKNDVLDEAAASDEDSEGSDS